MQEGAASALLLQWLKRVRESQLAHYASAERDTRKHLLVGIPATAFSAVVGTTVFSALSSEAHLDLPLKAAVALISVIAAILTGCQTFLRYSEKTDAHRIAAGKFAGLRRQIEILLTFPETINHETTEAVRKSIDEVTTSAPNVPSDVWKATLKNAGKEFFLSDRITEIRL